MEREVSSLKDLLATSIRSEAILRSQDQRLIKPDGGTYAWLIDIRKLCMQPTFLDAVAELFWAMCGANMPFQVGGMEVAAIPILSAILMKSVARGTPVNGFIVRKERKTYGAGCIIEGSLNDEPIVVVDDIFNSGGSLEKVRVVLEEEKRKIALVFALFDYLSAKGRTWKDTHSLAVVAPFKLSEFGLSLVNRDEPRPATVFRNVWRFSSPDPNFFHRVPKSFPATDGERVYFGSDCGIFWSLNAKNGAVAWRFRVNARGHKNIWSAPAISEGRVYFGSYDGNVYCLDAKSGTEIWRFEEADWIGSSPVLSIDLGMLFIGLEFAVEGKGGSVTALNLKTGEKIWEHLTRRYTHASPAYWRERGLVACGSNDNEMLLLDAETGNLLWRFQTQDHNQRKGSIRHAPAFDERRGQLITGCANGYIYIIDVERGSEVWSVRTDSTIYTVPLVVEDCAYVGSTDKYFYILDLVQRKVKTKIYTGAKILGPPRLLAGRIYFGACNGLVYEVDPSSASVTGNHQLPDAVTNALTFNEETGYFYALTYVNELFAFTRAL